MSDERFQQIQNSVAFLNDNFAEGAPDTAIILGSGLGPLADALVNASFLSYEKIPGFVTSTAPDHAGRLVVGELEGVRVLAMQGRFHYYEGYQMSQVVYPVQVFAAWGVKNLIVTNACGGINLTFKQGDLMLIRDIISMFCPSPLVGSNISELGSRFFDMTHPMSETLLQAARETGIEQGIVLREGVYVYAQGPHFETPADIRLLRILGADAVGMSTVPEIIAARHAQMQILGISCVTNMAAGITNKELGHGEVVEVGNQTSAQFIALVAGIVKRCGEGAVIL